jgi:DNA-binding transcriptional regulator PaaX
MIFDIPERERKKRDWIRSQLVSFGFEPLQKSVWSGGSPLPKNFIEDIEIMNLDHCIHIFSVRDSGTL